MEDCKKYWALADFLPVETIVEYWCQKSGFHSAHCREAKIAAIVAACEKEEIRYGRSDGKDFRDSPTDLKGRGILTIERESFDSWVVKNFEKDSPLPSKPLDVRERTAYLNTIAVLLEFVKSPRPGRNSEAAIIKEMMENYSEKYGISERGLMGKFAEAKRSLLLD